MRTVKESLRQQINMRNRINEAALANNVTFGNPRSEAQRAAFENVLDSIQNLRKEIMQLEEHMDNISRLEIRRHVFKVYAAVVENELVDMVGPLLEQ
ncbi:unnamed protein product [Caenorhabditis nigoni]